MALDDVRRQFEQLGRDDPMYAALTDHSRRGNRWDPEEFFANGRAEIREVVDWVETHGWVRGRERALDFGSGPGRLSQALADHFDGVVGVDISHTMVATAESLNRHGDRVRYVVNTRPDLALFDDSSFDFIYSSITLQHVPPEPAAAYVGEFIRILRPGGLAVFQARNGPRIRPGTLRARLYALRRERLRRVWQRLRGRPGYEMHALARSRVEEVVAGAGGRMLGVLDMNPSRPGRSFRYAATKPLPGS
jgi:SAM-dependent methyltransferase